MTNFITKYFPVIALVIMILIFFKGCGDTRKIMTVISGNNEITTEINSIKNSTYTKEELDIRLKIVGLESEKRMIQATDRKIFDVQRQNQIEEEIKYLMAELDKLELNEN